MHPLRRGSLDRLSGSILVPLPCFLGVWILLEAMDSRVSSWVATSPGLAAHFGGSEDAVGSSNPSDFRLGRRRHDASRTECLDLRASPEDEAVEGSQAEPVPFPADREQSSAVYLCLDNVYLYKRLRVYHLTTRYILDMSLNRALSCHTPIAD